jgi:hypothetical protein
LPHSQICISNIAYGIDVGSLFTLFHKDIFMYHAILFTICYLIKIMSLTIRLSELETFCICRKPYMRSMRRMIPWKMFGVTAVDVTTIDQYNPPPPCSETKCRMVRTIRTLFSASNASAEQRCCRERPLLGVSPIATEPLTKVHWSRKQGLG